MEHIEDESLDDESLDDDALSRLGVEEYAQLGNTFILPGLGNAGAVTTIDANTGGGRVPAPPWVHPIVVNDLEPLRVQGDALITGTITVDGSINNDTISDLQTVLADAQSRINDLQLEILAERADKYVLEDRVKKLEELLDSVHLTPKRY